MKIGIIVYSYTGNSFKVAKKMEETLLKEGHQVNLERITAVHDNEPLSKLMALTNKPAVEGYDVIIFGAPVQAFTLSQVMKIYMRQIGLLNGKKVLCFITKGSKLIWLGGNKAIKLMKEYVEVKKGEFLNSGIIPWDQPTTDAMIDEVVNRFNQTIKNLA